jgi:hypothetical protein
VDNAGNVYFTVPSQRLVKKWTASTGVISSFTTNGLSGFLAPYGVAVDAAGDVYVADTTANDVKKLGTRTIIIITTPLVIPFWNTIVSSNHLNSPWNLAVDDGGNVYIADGFHNAIKRFNYASNTVDTLVSSGLADPTGVAVDRNGNVYISDFDHNAIKELPHAFVDPSPRLEPETAGSDSLPTVLPSGQNLEPPFAPTSDQPWMTIGSTAGDAVGFDFEENTNTVPRTAVLTLLGQNILVQQNAAVFLPPYISSVSKSDDVFQLSFTNGTRGATYSVLFSTNVAAPLRNWSVIGTAEQVGEDLWQFIDTRATNETGFYMLRSP